MVVSVGVGLGVDVSVGVGAGAHPVSQSVCILKHDRLLAADSVNRHPSDACYATVVQVKVHLATSVQVHLDLHWQWCTYL